MPRLQANPEHIPTDRALIPGFYLLYIYCEKYRHTAARRACLAARALLPSLHLLGLAPFPGRSAFDALLSAADVFETLLRKTLLLQQMLVLQLSPRVLPPKLKTETEKFQLQSMKLHLSLDRRF